MKYCNQMKKSIIISISILILTSPAHAFDSWNTEEKIAQGVAIGLTIVDWGQTLYIADNPDRFYEKQNFMLAKHQSRSSVNLYFATNIILKTAFVHILPRDYNLWGWNIKPRRIAQSVQIGVSGLNTYRNNQIGIKVGF